MATVAMIREAARLIADLRDDDLVTFLKIGSEGAILRVNAFAREDWRLGTTHLIARDGTSCERSRPRP